jgi:hypothetical protein
MRNNLKLHVLYLFMLYNQPFSTAMVVAEISGTLPHYNSKYSSLWSKSDGTAKAIDAQPPHTVDSVIDQHSLQVLDYPRCRFAVSFWRDRAFLPLPCNQSRQRGRQLARVNPNQFVHQKRDGLRTLDVVMQRENWLIVQVCLVYLNEPDGPTHDTRRG